MNNVERYDSLDGLRAYCAIGIILVHVYLNTTYKIKGFVYNNIIPKFGWFVFLFMILSAFSMCCGYYDKIKNNKISPKEFYSKRYSKIFPFFSILVLLDLLISPSLASIYEGIANVTLVYGLLPNPNISVIGVGWTLGVIFVFYLLFPFFVYVLDNKKKSLFVFLITLILHFIGNIYFFKEPFVPTNYLARKNIIYCAIYFIIGGILYLNRKEIIELFKKRKKILNILIILITIGYFSIPENNSYGEIIFTLSNMLIFSSWMIYAIGNKNIILTNKFTRFISSISMEIYLCHMVVFRIFEKCKLLNLLKNDFCSYIITSILVLIGSIILSLLLNIIINIYKKRIKKA